ncbi:hypothetical protein EDI_000690 [Entamoeba dispar SAW760]|uniref:Protein kinase domain-containing protein n=1 Tax=Entamoeba dispar (strain ATCC PRA-260 / SAW760) TaxID=370354 RepID=B0EEJ4_ENTDS|nr:uncharacterized protein EDI_000690 [Entamoeba dispar SAW760]EDR27054.1 hypothetical protein EDI_000690 [Entamoeba dispar SAW760]|eukprot:EDR27054.1 hypothetical protein EDI_000690 [Entamoeba dispar SAW760]
MSQDKSEVTILYNGRDTKFNLNGEKVNFLYFDGAVVNKEYSLSLELFTQGNFEWKEKVVVVGVDMSSDEYQLYFDKSDFVFDGFNSELNENNSLSIIEKGKTIKYLFTSLLGINEKSYNRDISHLFNEKEKLFRREEEETKKLLMSTFCNASPEQRGKYLNEFIERIEKQLNGKLCCYVQSQKNQIELIKKIKKDSIDMLIKKEKNESLDDIKIDGTLNDYFTQLLNLHLQYERGTRSLWIWRNCKSYLFDDFKDILSLPKTHQEDLINDKGKLKTQEFSFNFKVLKPSTEIKMKLYFNYFEEGKLNKVEFKQLTLNIICNSSCLIDSSFLGKIDEQSGLVSLKVKNSETYKVITFDKKDSMIYQDKIITPLFLDNINQKYFSKYYGRSDENTRSSFLFTTEPTLFDFFNTRDRRLPLIDIISFTLNICKAIQILHTREFVHNHLNEKTILVEKNGKHINLKLGNLQQIYTVNSSVSLFNEQAEKSSFSSPEYLNSELVTYCNDVFSIGVLMVYLLQFDGNRSHLNVNNTIQQIIQTKDEEKVNYIKDQKFKCPIEFCECIANCLLPKEKRLLLEEPNNPKSLIPTLERMKLKYLL